MAATDGVNLAAPEPPPTPMPPSSEPMVAIQSQIGLLVVAVLAVLGFIFHSDLSDLAEPLGVIAFAIYGAAVAIARAMKHRTVTEAVLAHNSQRLDAWQIQQETPPRQAIQKAFDKVSDHTSELDQRLADVEAKVATKTPAKTTAKKTSSKPTKTATRARRASTTRKTSASR